MASNRPPGITFTEQASHPSRPRSLQDLWGRFIGQPIDERTLNEMSVFATRFLMTTANDNRIRFRPEDYSFRCVERGSLVTSMVPMDRWFEQYRGRYDEWQNFYVPMQMSHDLVITAASPHGQLATAGVFVDDSIPVGRYEQLVRYIANGRGAAHVAEWSPLAGALLQDAVAVRAPMDMSIRNAQMQALWEGGIISRDQFAQEMNAEFRVDVAGEIAAAEERNRADFERSLSFGQEQIRQQRVMRVEETPLPKPTRRVIILED